MTDFLIVGAGPAGMSAAVEAAQNNLKPLVIDNRPEPGGNIYAYLGGNLRHRPDRLKIFGKDYEKGAALVRSFNQAVAEGKIAYRASTRLWRLDPDGSFAFEGKGGSRAGNSRKVLLATGAHERPMPLPGWTLPGVLGVGAAQILMKSGARLPRGKIVIVGAGPLPLLLAEQLAVDGTPVSAVVEPEGASSLLKAAAKLHYAAAAPNLAMKGIALLGRRFLRRTIVYRNAQAIEIIGQDEVTGIKFSCNKGVFLEAATVLIHDGIVPNLNPLRAAGLRTEYSEQQATWHAKPNDIIQLAGDSAGILGVDAAMASGRLVAKRICGVASSQRDERVLRRQRSFRRFIDAAYPPVRTAASAGPDTVLCRCEMVTARMVEESVRTQGSDPNAIKRALRLGMGPCQGRMCSHSLSDFVGAESRIPSSTVGLPRARNPILPVSFETLANIK